jgi:hypothetical protein
MTSENFRCDVCAREYTAGLEARSERSAMFGELVKALEFAPAEGGGDGFWVSRAWEREFKVTLEQLERAAGVLRMGADASKIDAYLPKKKVSEGAHAARLCVVFVCVAVLLPPPGAR